jgi:hypothetical protein
MERLFNPLSDSNTEHIGTLLPSPATPAVPGGASESLSPTSGPVFIPLEMLPEEGRP